jgi:hypothetical protein
MSRLIKKNFAWQVFTTVEDFSSSSFGHITARLVEFTLTDKGPVCIILPAFEIEFTSQFSSGSSEGYAFRISTVASSAVGLKSISLLLAGVKNWEYMGMYSEALASIMTQTGVNQIVVENKVNGWIKGNKLLNMTEGLEKVKEIEDSMVEGMNVSRAG